MFDDVERDVGSIRLPQWGRVVSVTGTVPWLVVDPDGVPVEPVRRFLVDFVARDNRAGSVRSYAYDLLRWWRWLRAVGVEWDKATPAEVRDLVLWLKQTGKPRQAPRTTSAATAGRVNPITRKRHLGDRYEPRTIRHSNALEIGMAHTLVEALAGEFDPDDHADDYQIELKKMLHDAIAAGGRKITPPTGSDHPDREVDDLVAALQRSIDSATEPH